MDKIIILNLVFVCISAVNSVHKDSFKYKGDFVQINYDKNGNRTNITALSKGSSELNISQHRFEVDSDNDYNLQSILAGFTNALSNILKNQENTKFENQYNVSLDVNNKTHIFINAFKLYNLTSGHDLSKKNIPEADNVSNTDENTVNTAQNVSFDSSSDLQTSLSVSPINTTHADRDGKTYFSERTINDLLTRSVTKPITKINLENQENSTTLVETLDLNKHRKNSSNPKATTIKMNSDTLDVTSEQPAIAFYRTSDSDTLDTIKLSNRLHEQDTNALLFVPIKRNNDLLDMITKNFTAKHYFNNTENVLLEEFSNTTDTFENIPWKNYESTRSAAEKSNFTTPNFVKETTFDNSEGTADKQNVTSNEEITSNLKFVSSTEKIVQTTEKKDSKEVSLVDLMQFQASTDIKEPSSAVATTTDNISSTELSPESTTNSTTVTAEISTVSSTETASAKSTTPITTVLRTTAKTEKLSPTIDSNSMKRSCCNKTAPHVNDLKVINVDKILILMPMVTRVEVKNLTAQSVTENSKINVNETDAYTVDHSMTKRTNKGAFDPKEILKKDKENELYDDTINLDDILDDDNETDYLAIDYVDFYKDVMIDDFNITAELNYTDVESVRNEVEHKLMEYALQTNEGVNNVYARSVLDCHGNSSTMGDAVFPWIVTIFRKNGSSEEFEYFCDGVLLNNKAVLTSARCVTAEGIDLSSNLIVILGKKNLKTMHDKEIVIRASHLYTHPSYRPGGSEADLAIIILDSEAPHSNSIRAACLDCDSCGDVELAATTGWALSGELTPIFFKKETTYELDKKATKFTATYGFDISICPSHGGLYLVQRQGAWYVGGISASDPSDRSLCLIRTLEYTSLRNYVNWINDVLVRE